MEVRVGKILWIEGNRSDTPPFVADVIAREHHVHLVPNGNKAMQCIDDFQPEVVVINAASQRTSGTRICKALRNAMPKCPVILIADQEHYKETEATATLILPFTRKKLLNCVETYLPNSSQEFLKVGPVKLDIEHKVIKQRGKPLQHLTPKQTQLLKVLMENAGEVVERDALFCEVWDTDYTGDTRTLDVHMSSLRKILEDDTREPKHIISVRGVGYKFVSHNKK
jgi:DNA-binding response OmpR family regulator